MLRRSLLPINERQLRAVYAGQTDPPLGESAVVLPEVRFEPSLTNAALDTSGGKAQEARLANSGNRGPNNLPERFSC